MKRQKILFILPLIALFLGSNCNAQLPQINTKLSRATTEIEKINKSYFEAFVKNESSLLTGQYTDDCWIMSSDSPALCGVNAALDFFNRTYSDGVRGGWISSIEVCGDPGSYLTETGLFQFSDTNGKVVQNGTFITLWKKTLRGWKRHKNSFNQ